MPRKQEKSTHWDRLTRTLQLNEGETWPFQAGYPDKTSTGGHVFFQLSADGTRIAKLNTGHGQPISFGVLYIDAAGKMWRASAYVTDVLDANNCPAWVNVATGGIIPYNSVVAWAGPRR